VCIINKLGSLMEHLSFMLAAEKNGITNAKYLEPTVITKIYYLLKIIPLPTERVRLGGFNQVCFAVDFNKIGYSRVTHPISGDNT